MRQTGLSRIWFLKPFIKGVLCLSGKTNNKQKILQSVEIVGFVLLLSPFVFGFLRYGRKMNHLFKRQLFNILTKSENSVPRMIPKSFLRDFQSFASFQ
jgi:hypothetical protein